MVCKYCGTEVNGTSRFCTNCGADLYPESVNNAQPTVPNYQQPNYQQPNYQQPNYQQPNYNGYNPYYNQNQGNGGQTWATWALVMGIMSIICMGWIWSVLAFCFASNAKKQGYVGGKTTAAIVCGIIGLVLTVLVLVFSSIYSVNVV